MRFVIHLEARNVWQMLEMLHFLRDHIRLDEDEGEKSEEESSNEDESLIIARNDCVGC